MKPLPPLLFAAALLAAPLCRAATLVEQHVDLGINFRAAQNQWQLTVRDEDAFVEYDAGEVILQGAAQAQTTVPQNPSFSFLGNPGDPVWILPQVQDDGVLFLGVSSEMKDASEWEGVGVGSDFLVRGFSGGTFSGNSVTLRLLAVSGPGHFAAYSLGAFATPTVFYNTRDGLTAADTQTLSPAIHRHLNWAFSAPGDYTLTLQASGTLAAGGQLTMSAPTEFRFQIIPEPGAAALALAGLAALAARRRRPFSETKTDHHATAP